MASKEKTVLTGQLKRWNETKGFGFISTENGQRDIFIHISDLKGMSRRPMVGDTIHYQIKVQDDGKNRAINARIEGVKPLPNHPSKKTSKNKKNMIFGVVFIAVIIITALVFI
ncbi:Cold shock protein of CSP family [hydrothermal vent metagenome]|uniref:Cold shock protein of CSP family n=1 Tax=hydrothermal vent metagenome TaxID=652676 RepID=A0A3B0VZM5_9ZZZZ